MIWRKKLNSRGEHEQSYATQSVGARKLVRDVCDPVTRRPKTSAPSGLKGALRYGLEPLQGLCGAAMVGLQPKYLPEIPDRVCPAAQLLVGVTAIAVGLVPRGIEPDRRVVVGDGLSVSLEVEMGVAAIVVGGKARPLADWPILKKAQARQL